MAKSGAIKISAIHVNVSVTRSKFYNLFGCWLVISEVFPINALQAVMKVYMVSTVEVRVERYNILVTTTGCKDILTS